MSEMSLDEIMSGRGEPVSEPKAAPEATPEPSAPAEGAAQRDEKGRFAAKAEPDKAEPAPAAAEPQPAPVTTEQQPSGHVPLQALDAERSKRKALEDQLRDMQAQITRLSQPAAPAEPQKPAPTLWDDPDAFLQSQLTPVQQQLMDQREWMSETMAIQAHGQEKVEAAKRAIEEAARTPDGQMIIQRMMQSRHPFDDLVKWHAEHSFRSEIGSDPEAYRQKVIADYLASQQQTAQPQAAATAPAPVMPTAFAKSPTSGPRGPEVASGPRALSDIMKR